jgi:hypothetical protein
LASTGLGEVHPFSSDLTCFSVPNESKRLFAALSPAMNGRRRIGHSSSRFDDTAQQSLINSALD